MQTRVVNEKGLEVGKMEAVDVALRSVNRLDISRFAKGNYFIEVFIGGGQQASARLAFSI
ncbi:MAG: hypothetical protein EOP49_50435 [Sphingobacteriales bacterium]|nr:MAG: hypothetical protein EOP49_50435 [Sphingobacteriales bacterium]